MRRSLAVHCPTVRKTVGSSFGTIAISATMPIRRSSPQPISNIEIASPSAITRERALRSAPRSRAPPNSSTRLVSLHRRAAGGWDGLMVDAFYWIGLGGLCFSLLILRQPFLERFDALGEIAHEVRDLAAPAEQQQTNGQDQNPVPNAHRTHSKPSASTRAHSYFGVA